MLIAGGARPAAAERLVVSLSNHRVQVTSSFIGEDLVLFGTVEPDQQRRQAAPRATTWWSPSPARARPSARGARSAWLGIWVNTDSREFVKVPSYLAILSNRPVAQIANKETLRRLQIGLDQFPAAAAHRRRTSPTPCRTTRSASPSCG